MQPSWNLLMSLIAFFKLKTVDGLLMQYEHKEHAGLAVGTAEEFLKYYLFAM